MNKQLSSTLILQP